MKTAIAKCPMHHDTVVINHFDTYLISVGVPRCEICGMEMKTFNASWRQEINSWQMAGGEK